VPEDPIHSKNTREWVFKLNPDADTALQIAALGHDVERAIKERKVKREDFTSYDEFKSAHAKNSAEILKGILTDCNIRLDLIQDIVYLVIHHEVGGDDRSNILKDADSISFFDVNLPYYAKRCSMDEVRFRIDWGYKRLSKNAKRIVHQFID